MLQVSRPLFPFFKLVWADGGYERVTAATTITVEIVRKQSHQVALVVLPMCWVVERFLAWIKSPCLAKGFETTVESAAAFLYAASVMRLTRY